MLRLVTYKASRNKLRAKGPTGAAMKLLSRITALATLLLAAAFAQAADAPESTVHYRTASIDGVNVFYREAGPRDAPAVVLLHGFPSSSNMFRNLIPAL